MKYSDYLFYKYLTIEHIKSRYTLPIKVTVDRFGEAGNDLMVRLELGRYGMMKIVSLTTVSYMTNNVLFYKELLTEMLFRLIVTYKQNNKNRFSITGPIKFADGRVACVSV